MTKVTVLGAGMSGLAVAEGLVASGIPCRIVEATSTAGGASGSFAWGGFDFNDFGPHIWHTRDQDLAQEWSERFENLFHVSEFYSANVLGNPPGDYFHYPLSFETIEGLNEPLRKQIRTEIQDRNLPAAEDSDSFDSYVEQLAGPTLRDMFFKGYPEKLWGISTQEMTAAWAPKRIRITDRNEPYHAGEWCAVGREGSGTILNRMAADLESSGVEFIYDFEVSEISGDLKNSSFKLVSTERNELYIPKEDFVVSTIPINQLAKMVGIGNNLRFRGAFLIFVKIKRTHVLPGQYSFLYFPQPDVVFHRVSEQKKFCGAGWPLESTTLTCEVAYSADGPDLIDPESLVKQCLRDLRRFGLVEDAEIIDTTWKKLDNVYPVNTLPLQVEHRRVRSQLQSSWGFFLLGTGGDYHYADLQILYRQGRDIAVQVQQQIQTGAVKSFRSQALTSAARAHESEPEKLFFPLRPFVIAELGLNHNGLVPNLIDLAKAAAQCGVEVVKLQVFAKDSRISSKVGASTYTEDLLDTEESDFAMFERLSFSFAEWAEVASELAKLKIRWFATVFDQESLALCEELSCPAYKIASMDVNNFPLLRDVAETEKPLVVSTGMSSLGAIEKCLETVQFETKKEFALLHCISAYPARLEDMNLRAINTLRTNFGCRVGLSDHTIGLTAATIALAFGASLIEKHFTLNKALRGPDHILSADEEEMQKLVALCDSVPLALGSGRKRVEPVEIDSEFRYKKSIFARKLIKEGQQVTIDDLTLKGPNLGLAPELINLVVGQAAKTDIPADKPITLEDLDI